MNITNKRYIGYLGWSGNSVHIISVGECDCEKFEGIHSHSDPYAACKPNTGMHYRIGVVNRIRKVEPTKENVTCKNCLEHLK